MLCAAEEQAEAAKAKAAKGHSSPAKRNAKARNDEGYDNIKLSHAFAYIHSTQLGLGHSTQLGGPDCGTGGCPPGHTIMSSDVFSYIHSPMYFPMYFHTFIRPGLAIHAYFLPSFSGEASDNTLERPRAADAAAAALDDAREDGDGDGDGDDPSVKTVERPPGSRSPTPPPRASQARLADELAARSARGEVLPGFSDGDALVEGRPDSDVDDNVQAVAAATDRRRNKPPPAKRPLPADADSEPEAVSTTKGGKSAKKNKRPNPPSPEPVDSDDPDARTASRHKPVSTSAIYTMYDGPALAEARRRFQTLIFARDGSPIKSLTIHRQLNFKLVLIAAKDVMDPKLFKDFKNAMYIAYKDTSKE